MNKHPQQIFNFQLAAANTFATFFADRSPLLIANLKSLSEQDPIEEQIFIWGAGKTGKTHLLQAVCHRLADTDKRAMYIPLAEFKTCHEDVFEGLASMDVVCVDDIESVAGNAKWEKALFNFINQMRAKKNIIVFSSRQNPSQNIFNLADLNSRLVWGPVFHLPGLDQEALEGALRLHADARGIELPDVVINYLLTHFKRDASVLVELLKLLDHTSLQEQRKVTVPFIKQVLANQ